MDFGEVKHVSFVPTKASLAAVCDDWERGGWELVRVVQNPPFESIAVFARGRTENR